MSEHFTCVDCGRGFTLSYERQRWFRERGMAIPKRCSKCLSRRRAARDPGNRGLSGPPVRPSTQAHRRPRASSRSPQGKQRAAGRPSRPSSRRAPARASTRQPRRKGAARWWRDADTRFGPLGLGFVVLAGAAAWIAGSPWWLVLLVIVLVVNLITLALYRYDKAVSGSDRTRVPERILLILALLGGSPAAYVAIYKFRKRHKARKTSFVVLYWLIVAGQVVVVCGLLAWLLSRR